MCWRIGVQRIDNSGPYATVETIETAEGESMLEHDQTVTELKEKYGEDDHVRIVGPDHTFYKDINLGVHYI
jgi:hypothetical protein